MTTTYSKNIALLLVLAYSELQRHIDHIKTEPLTIERIEHLTGVPRRWLEKNLEVFAFDQYLNIRLTLIDSWRESKPHYEKTFSIGPAGKRIVETEMVETDILPALTQIYSNVIEPDVKQWYKNYLDLTTTRLVGSNDITGVNSITDLLNKF